MSEGLKQLFQNSAVPAPRSGLADQIMIAANQQTPLMAANDRKNWFWTAAAGIAATAMVGLFIVSSQPDEAEIWQSHADATGFSELYSWTGGETE